MNHPLPSNLTPHLRRRICAALFLPALLLSLPRAVQAQFTYITNGDGALTITGYTGPGGDVTIPATIVGHPVTAIGDGAFHSGAATITDVTIPNTVTSIGDSAFFSCQRMTRVQIPNSVSNIGGDAFADCLSLTNIVLPNSVTTVGLQAFSWCSKLTKVSISTGLRTIPYGLFQACTSLGSITVPNNITSIGPHAFDSCTNLTNVTISDALTDIGEYAFGNCTSLRSVTLPGSLTSIGNYAFYCCATLTNATIPASVANIGYAPFESCASLTVIWVDPFNPFYSSVDGVLYSKDLRTLVEYPPGKGASFAIPVWVTVIGYGAFELSVSLQSVTLPDSVIIVGDCAFASCTNLFEIKIPGNVTSIGYMAFSECYKLVDITIPDSVTNLGSYAFAYCPAITNLVIGNGLAKIPAMAFNSCSNLTSVTIPESVTSIAAYAFEYCALRSIYIPNSVTNIGDSAFFYCSHLTIATIGSGVVSLGNQIFYGCSNTPVVYFLGNAPSLSGSLFGYYPVPPAFPAVSYLAGTTGWSFLFGGLRTVVGAPPPPAIQSPPVTQTAEAGSAVGFRVQATSSLPLSYHWYFKGTNDVGCTNSVLQLTSAQYSQSGPYTVVVASPGSSVTSPPAVLNVIAPVERRIVTALTLVGQVGTSLNLDFTAALSPAPLWTTFDQVLLTESAQWYFDLSSPLPQQGFYRAWFSGAGVPPALGLHFAPAITLSGPIGTSLRVDCINQFGPIDAWVTLATVTLTNITQLYFDTSAIGQPPRLWRVVPVP